MRALIAAGGTGGHIYPALAVAQEIIHRTPESEVRFVGTARGLETRLVPQAGFELSLIESAGLVNMGMAARARGLALLPRSFLAARRLIRSFHPEIVVGAGGYVTGPVLLTAALLRLPTLVMESNAIPGFTNRRLARFVRAAAVSFEVTVPFFPGKAIVTGNPVRPDFFRIPAKQRDPKSISLLLFGGSLLQFGFDLFHLGGAFPKQLLGLLRAPRRFGGRSLFFCQFGLELVAEVLEFGYLLGKRSRSFVLVGLEAFR